jgi:hypothetical protein
MPPPCTAGKLSAQRLLAPKLALHSGHSLCLIRLQVQNKVIFLVFAHFTLYSRFICMLFLQAYCYAVLMASAPKYVRLSRV